MRNFGFIVLVSFLVLTGCVAPSSTSQEPQHLSNQTYTPRRGKRPDLNKAAGKLDVSVEELRQALGSSRPPDFEAAAKKLGISVEQLMEALFL